MERRKFLRYIALAGGSAMLPSYLWAFSEKNKQFGHRRLVVIQLAGGNDGLNTIIPFNSDIYYKSRPTIAIPKSEVLKASNELGFNPNLVGLKKLFDKNQLSIINNVGYPKPNRSHFRSTDIWQSASDSDKYLTTGWLGRYMDIDNAIPSSGIELDDSLSMILKGKKVNGIAAKNPKLLYANARNPFFKELLKSPINASDNANLNFLYKTMRDAESSAKYINEHYGKGKNYVEYKTNPFASQLKTTARLINSQIGTEVFFISMGGFDTHANQLVRQNKLLKIYSDAIHNFVNDLEQGDSFKDTLIMTFSEFGRRVKQNAANGTDHGTANNVFVICKELKKPGFFNKAPNLNNLDDNGDLIYRLDFREIYNTILQNWLGASANSVVLNNKFNKLDFI